jgi:putative FmdB family regulatory protein
MPTYEYGCAACGSEWEEIQRITEPPIEVCPKCGKPSAHRLISAGGGFILKGGGWYSDLYSSAKPASNKEESKSTTSPDAAKTESAPAKTETKSEAKSTPPAPAPTPPATSST